MTTNIEHPSDSQLILAMDGELAREEAASVGQHLAGCENCRMRWDRFGGISGQIVACHKALESGRLQAPAQRRQIARAGGFIAAAAALALVAMYLTRAEKPAPVAHLANSPTQVSATVAQKSATPHHRASRRRPSRLVAADMSNIVELPFSNSALPLTDATVVRLELPIEELRLTGLMVDGGRAGTVVQADVLMGIDGLPRAIRLVR